MYKVNELPKMNTDNSETGCCPKFNPEPWKDEKLEFDDKLFVKAKTTNFLHVPLNMGSVMTKVMGAIQNSKSELNDGYFMLSDDSSLWRGEHYIAVSKEVPDYTNLRLSGKFLTRTFEGPYNNAGRWRKEMKNYVSSKGKNLRKIYFFYTTCPKCAKHYGENHVVGVAEVD
ncbi:MAG: hydrolase [Bacteroidota bacterium]